MFMCRFRMQVLDVGVLGGVVLMWQCWVIVCKNFVDSVWATLRHYWLRLGSSLVLVY